MCLDQRNKNKALEFQKGDSRVEAKNLQAMHNIILDQLVFLQSNIRGTQANFKWMIFVSEKQIIKDPTLL